MNEKELTAWATLARAGAECAMAWRTIAEAGAADWPGNATGEPSAAEAWAREADRWAAEGAAMIAPFPREEAAAMLDDADGRVCALGRAAWTLGQLADFFGLVADRSGDRAEVARLAAQHVREAAGLARSLGEECPERKKT